MTVKNSKFLYILLLLVPSCVFLNALLGGFVYDDIAIIEENYFIRSFQNIPKIFSEEYFLLSEELSYRPVATFSYFLDYTIWQLNPFGYHLTNVILHTANTFLLYLLLVWIFKKRSIAFLSALLFSVHPCITEAVNAIGYREDLFVGLFSFLSCLFLIKTIGGYITSCEGGFSQNLLQDKKDRKKREPLPHSLKSQKWVMRVYYALSLLCYLLSLFSKETAIVTPLFIFLYWVYCMPKFEWKKYFACYCLGYILISLFYLGIRFVVLKNPQEESIGYLGGSSSVNFMTMAKVLASYIKHMFFPFHLSADYVVSPVTSFSDFSFLTSVVFLAAVGIVLIRSTQKDKTYCFFTACFFVSFLPVLNIIPIGHVMAERYLYLPVAGFCGIVGGLLSGISTAPSANTCVMFPFSKTNRVFNITSVVFLLFIPFTYFTVKTVSRNRVWQSEYTFWTTILKDQPQNYDAHNNLGCYFYKQRELDRAIHELKTAVTLKENYSEGHNSLGAMYIDKGLIDEAINEYSIAVKHRPVFPQAYYNLGNACIKKGLIDEGIAFFKKAVRLGMRKPQVYNNLGSAFIKKGMLEDSIMYYQKALSVYNDFPEVHSNLGYIYTEKGDLEKAVFELEKALQLQPNHANAHNNLGALYCRMGLWDQAHDEFLQAIISNPGNASAHKNLGMIYFTKGDRQMARKHFVQMLKCDPNYLKDAGVHAIVLQLGIIEK
ncbi:MAG: tetratricopeptide repeat protein [Candidatus Brocadiaceae bacterium]|nr:tetratricopeptide repeat protein [Candidatus Brocadiaceae bacterium]